MRKDAVVMSDLTSDQVNAYDVCKEFIDKDPHKGFITITGYAGTGKTTVLAYVYDYLVSHKQQRVAVMSYTGKSVTVLRSKGILGAMTIHSSIYDYRRDENNNLVSFIKSDFQYDWIIIDEYSMINEQLFSDIKALQVPIILFGDNYQLPPPSGIQNNLVSDYTMHDIVRQKGMLVKYSTEIRLHGYESVAAHGWYKDNDDDELVIVTDLNSLSSVLNELKLHTLDYQFLCYTNKTRFMYNNSIRTQYVSNSTDPTKNDKLIATKNIWMEGIVNGYTYKVLQSDSCIYKDYNVYKVKTLTFDGFVKDMYIESLRLSDPSIKHEKLPSDIIEMDYAYCMTVHKSQGSEWDNIIIIDDYPSFSKVNDPESYNRWLYTAITRSRSIAILVRNI